MLFRSGMRGRTVVVFFSPALSFLFSAVLCSPEVSVLLYLHPTQLLVGREGSGRNRLNAILLQTSAERTREEEARGEIPSVNKTIHFSEATDLHNPPHHL